MDDRAEQMVLLGYDSAKAYKLYDPNKRRVVKSRDILVDESKRWNWETCATTNIISAMIVDLDDN